MINDQQIVSDILLGGRAKERAITTLWENLETKVLAIVMTKGNSREDAEEALSDGVFLFCEMVESGKYEDGKIEALVTTLAVRAAISRYRKENKVVEKAGGIPADELTAVEHLIEEFEDILAKKETLTTFSGLLNKLKEDCKKALLTWIENKNKGFARKVMEKLGFKTEQSANNKVGKCKAELKQLIKNTPGLIDDLLD